jgi:hypothetical protein
MVSIRGSFEQILLTYTRANRKSNKFERAEIASFFKSATLGIRDTDTFKKRKSKLKIRFGTGMGNYAHIPWIALLNKRVTGTTQKGVYCAYLFRADMSGIYLTLTQGVSDSVRHKSTNNRACELRLRLGALKDWILVG